MRSERVVDAVQMAIWRRHPAPGAIVHADRGSQYTSWIFGHRLRQAGLLGSMGRVASSVDNTMMESFCRACSVSCSTAAVRLCHTEDSA
ncbi:DDE-type integrase/transposase/recombinase [Cellulomonas sp. Y8]|uniref:DDE-type integrase/transposase/recombinase n=1 Tax=Cellulomonas sp. Y8 TaxID=2591145 RepID=UPI0011C9A754|nr:DDE-type integrase/transposase/recombinase [Cellulomonas sp. Y8]